MTIVLGYVPAAHGAAALEVAVAEARLRDKSLLVINGHRESFQRDPKGVTDDELDELRSTLTEKDICFDIERVSGPDVAEQILAAATRVKASLIVIGVKGRTPIGKLILGSVGQRLIMEADCPVVTVKAQTQP